jgi:hypothetical protein
VANFSAPPLSRGRLRVARKFEDVVKSAQDAAVLVLAY